MTQSQWEAAPFNEVVVPQKEFKVTVSQTLSKTVPVLTDTYYPEFDAEYQEYIPNTEDVRWDEEYHANGFHTPIQLLGLFKQFLEKNLEKDIVFMSKSYSEQLIEECANWTEDECEYIEE